MKLRRLEIRDFRKLVHVEIAELGDGLNVVVGDNEAGKSTLLAALRAVLFERHRVGGDVAAAMQPYGQQVRPQVWLDFERDGVAYQLHKAFCQRQEAELSGGGERFTGDAVEDKLAEMFGFSPPGRGGSKPGEHHGIFGLLWVEQGTAHHALEATGSRDRLAAALEREVGQITGGDRGRLLLAAAEERRGQFFDRRGNPRGDFKDLASMLAAKIAERGVLQLQLAAQEQKIARLADLQEILVRHERDDSLAQAERKFAAARLVAEELARQQQALRSVETERDNARLRLGNATAKLSSRQNLAARLDLGMGESQRAEAQLGEGQARVDRLDAAYAQASVRAAGLEALASEAAAVVAKLELAARRKEAASALANLERQLQSAEAADAARRTAQAAVESEPLTPEDLQKLEPLERALAQSQAQLDAASVHIDFEPQAGRTATIEESGEAVGAELVVSRDTALHLEGYGRLKLRLGGDLDQRGRMVGEAEAKLRAELAHLGKPDVPTVRAALARLAELKLEMRSTTQIVRSLAPNGIDAIRQEISRLKLVAGDAPVEAIDGDPVAARSAAEAARARLETAAGEAKAARTALDAERSAMVLLKERAAVAAEAHRRDREALLVARQPLSDAALEADVAAERDAVAQAEARLAAARAVVEGADPEATQLRLRQTEQAAKSVRADIDATERERIAIDAELRALGKDGIGESIEALNGEIAFDEARLQSMTLEAAAAKLLAETLGEAERETKEAWLQPVRDRSAPYLRLVETDSAIVLRDDSFEIDQIVRNGVAEPYQGLSVGAREQIAVITRLALADILREGGQESCVVLDDALVNTDERRLERMHLVLHRAAQHQQILILTCRERDFLQLGAPIRRM